METILNLLTQLYGHPDIFLHDSAADHGAMAHNRLEHIYNVVSQTPNVQLVEAIPASRSVLELAHTAAFVEKLHRAAPDAGETFGFDNETVMNEHTLRTLLLSAGAACQAVDAVLDGMAKNAFCVTYAGHHATPDKAMGFCFTNPVAIAGKHALARGVQRLAVLDIDTHSGNGTVMAFLNDGASVLFAETYQPGYPLACMPSEFPSHIHRHKVRNPNEFVRYWRDLLSTVRAFGPELILVSAGFDAHQADPLGRQGLSDEHYRWIAGQIAAITPRMVAVLEGGYNLGSTSRCASIFLSEMVEA